MALRTTKKAVRDILLEQYALCEESGLGTFLRTANTLVNWLENTCDTAHINSAEGLADIEMYLAAHFYGVSERLLTSKSQGGASGSFQGQTGKYYEATIFGQQAIGLDLSGCLAKLQSELVSGKKAVVQFGWGGLPKSEKTSYEDRNS